MITNQLERLKQDYTELGYFIQRLQKEGMTNNSKVCAIQRKQQYLERVIQEMQGKTLTSHEQAA